MKVAEYMTPDVELIRPDATIQQAAQVMTRIDVGALPVAENDQLVGMVTDRDIVIRAIAQGRGPDTPIREVMTDEVKYCYEDEDIEDVASNMGDQQLHRLPVLNRDKRLVGIVALADVAVAGGNDPAGEAVSGISRDVW